MFLLYQDDYDDVLERAFTAGVDKIIVTGKHC